MHKELTILKKVVFVILYICILTIVIPFISVKIGINHFKKENYINVYIKSEDKVEKMNTSQYLKEVVAAEMPAEFSFEALKAQAVAARTYLENRKISNTNDEAHKGADICTDSTHCKAWKRESEIKNSWEKDKCDEYWDKISRAVEETQGQILTYKGKPISAVFHSTSSGITESAKDVWGNDIPYLQNVQSEGDLHSPKYHSEYLCSIDEYKNNIEKNIKNTNPDSQPFSDILRSPAGGIITMKVYGAEIKGTDFRSFFGLQSTNIQLEIKENNVYMSVLGYGHGVGMSQYGAAYMGSHGSSYKDILSTYYPGTTLELNHS